LSFADAILKTLNEAEKKLEAEKRRSAEDKAELAKSLAETADEIRNIFGYAEANQFMATVLTATEQGVSENRLASAVNQFLSAVRNTALTSMAKRGLTDEEAVKANSALKKLDKLIDYLNKGNEESSKPKSLAEAINKYFGGADLPEEEKKLFTADFRFVSEKELKKEAEEEAKNKAAQLAAFVITKAEVGPEAIEAAVNYLSDEVSSQKAASILADLKDDGDIFEAVDEVRSVLAEEDSEASKGADAATGALASGSSAAKLLNEAVRSAGKSALFNQFLDNYFLTQVNKTIQNNTETANRLKTSLSFKTGIEYSFGAIGINSWPGLAVVHSTGVSVSIGFEREFSVSVDKDNKIEAKFTQSVKIEASFKSSASTLLGGSSLLAAATYLTLAQALEARYTSGKIASNSGFQSASSMRGSYLLSSVV
jgi:hypothetical protein